MVSIQYETAWGEMASDALNTGAWRKLGCIRRPSGSPCQLHMPQAGGRTQSRYCKGQIHQRCQQWIRPGRTPVPHLQVLLTKWEILHVVQWLYEPLGVGWDPGGRQRSRVWWWLIQLMVPWLSLNNKNCCCSSTPWSWGPTHWGHLSQHWGARETNVPTTTKYSRQFLF